MLNPNKYIRQGIINAIGGAVPVYYKRVPKTIATPANYIIINSQTKQESFRAKKCWEWLCQVNIDIWSVGTQGMPPNVSVDDLEETVLNAMESMQVTGGFTTNYCDLINDIDLSVETDTHSIERKVLTYEIWLNKKA